MKNLEAKMVTRSDNLDNLLGNVGKPFNQISLGIRPEEFTEDNVDTLKSKILQIYNDFNLGEQFLKHVGEDRWERL